MQTRVVVFLAALAVASAFQPALRASLPKANTRSAACSVTMQSEGVKKAAIGLAALPLSILLGASSAEAITSADVRSLTYSQVKGTGLANRCPEVAESGTGKIDLYDGKKYKIVDLCLEPKSFQIEEEVSKKRGQESKKEFVDTKLMTRATYSLSGVQGPIVSDDAGLVFKEKDGIDYAATTVQLPGGERVPFLFTIKELSARFSSSEIEVGTELGGSFRVPSYRTGLFLDPKGRGGTTGYDMAVALPGKEADGAEGQSDLFAETNKVFQVTDGAIEMAVSKVDAEAKEFSGVFVSEQLSDTDMGSKAPKKVLLKGIMYGRIAEMDGSEDY